MILIGQVLIVEFGGEFFTVTPLRLSDWLIIIGGTSLVVYPAAGLLNYVRRGVPVYYIDPRPSRVPDGVTVIRKPATTGMAELEELLLKQFGHHEKD